MNLSELASECTFERVSPDMFQMCNSFSCGHEDLDDFFRNDYKLYADKLLGKTYAFRLKDCHSEIVSLFTLSNDAIRIKQLLSEDKERIVYVTENGEKNLLRFPGVLIGRLGTNIKFTGFPLEFNVTTVAIHGKCSRPNKTILPCQVIFYVYLFGSLEKIA